MMVDPRWAFSPRFVLLAVLMGLAVACRLLTATAPAWSGVSLETLAPYIVNVAPVAAMALFGGALFRDVRLAFVVPLAVMLISDTLLQVCYWQGWTLSQGFHAGMPIVYLAFVLVIALGRLVGEWLNPLSVVAGSLAGSVLFFVVTNFGVWASGVEASYPMNLSGLVACFTAALPYFRNTVLGDLAFNTLLFGSYALAVLGVPSLRPVRNNV
jgi:hypothetical protein